jgi:anthranilate synthase component 2
VTPDAEASVPPYSTPTSGSVLVIDNYDSFTYNLVQYLGELGEHPVVRRNDAMAVDDIGDLAPRAIVISPGPCTPAEAGISVPLVQRWGGAIPILGVCLGHQAIGEAYGARVVRAGRVMHGKTSEVTHDGCGLFEGLPSPLRVMRYHSLIVDRASLPSALAVLAQASDDPEEVHAMRHRQHPVWGVQFHPESVLTSGGKRLLANFLRLADTHQSPRAIPAVPANGAAS